MLVVTRKEGDEVVINAPGLRNPIVVRVTGTRSDRVLLGFKADRDVAIHRGELLDSERSKSA